VKSGRMSETQKECAVINRDDAKNDAVREAENSGGGLKRVKALQKEAAQAYAKSDFSAVIALTSAAKGFRVPVRGLDYLRALAWQAMGSPADAYESIKEELRWFPDSPRAMELYAVLARRFPGHVESGEDAEFAGLFAAVRPYTMLSPKRLHSLFTHARDVCGNGPRGNFVECGVAGGGSSGLLSKVIAEHSPYAETLLFCCDSFSGMPAPTEHDTHAGLEANDTGWGEGTCSAPESSLRELCDKLGTRGRIRTVKGFFEETLRDAKAAMGPIAFLHMDGDWYSSTRTVLEELYDSLVPGAFVQIDDFGYWDGCRKAVREFEEQRGLAFSLTPVDGSGVFFFKP